MVGDPRGLRREAYLKRLGLTAALAAILSVAFSTWDTAPAQAQTTFEQVEPGFKGVIGLGLVGAELGFIIPAVAGLHETWAFIVFPVVGAAGGAVGGYFLFEQPGETELSVAALAVGMAMIIPTMVITLSSTAYDPDDEGVETDAEFSGEFEEGVELEGGGSGGGESEPPPEAGAERARRVARAGAGLLRWADDGDLMLGVPGLALAPSYSGTELQRYGGEQRTELHVPIVSGAF